MVKNSRLEQDGLYICNPEHWETWETKVRIYKYGFSQKYKTINGKIKIYSSKQKISTIYLPIDLVRHLKLEHNDKIQVAIRKAVKNVRM